MKITKEQFDKLPQLDRIEFRQKLILKHSDVNTLFLLSFLFSLAGLSFKNNFAFSIFLTLGIAIFFVALIRDKSDKIKGEYFTEKIEVKK